MMPYTELQQTFVRQLQSAITDYQALFVQRRMPAHRATDIAAINELLNDTFDIEQLKTGIHAVLIQFKTGWFIFSTGNSRLKHNILSHLNNPQFSPDAFLKSRIFELEQTTRELEQVTPLEHVLRGYEGISQDEEIQAALKQARQELSESRVTIHTLRTENKIVHAENARLITENERLRENNHRLSVRLQAKRTSEQFASSQPISINGDRPGPHPEDLDAETISPGTSLARSFKAFPASWKLGQ